MISRLNNTSLSTTEFDSVVDRIPETKSLSEVLSFAVEAEFFRLPPKVVPLDEFTFDVVFEHKSRLWFVFGTT